MDFHTTKVINGVTDPVNVNIAASAIASEVVEQVVTVPVGAYVVGAAFFTVQRPAGKQAVTIIQVSGDRISNSQWKWRYGTPPVDIWTGTYTIVSAVPAIMHTIGPNAKGIPMVAAGNGLSLLTGGCNLSFPCPDEIALLASSGTFTVVNPPVFLFLWY